MSNDPRGYRGYSGNQRHSGQHGRENDHRGGGRGDARVAQRGYSHIDQSNTDDSESNPAGQTAFSSFRPEAYAAEEKRASQNASAQQGRQDWNNAPPSTNDMYSQQAPERSAGSMHQVLQQRLDRLGDSLNSALSGATDNDSTAGQRANLYGLLGAFRGISEAGLAYWTLAEKIDWPRIREEKFSGV